MDQLISRRELDHLGFTKGQIAHAIDAAELQRVRRGVYRIPNCNPGDEMSHEVLVRATVALGSDDAVVSGWSAAGLHGLPVDSNFGTNRVMKTWPASSHGRKGKVTHSRLARFQPDEVVTVRGLAVTSVERTCADLARTSELAWGVTLYDQALRLGLTRGVLERGLERWPRRPGIRKARLALAWADPRSESVGESLSRTLIRRRGLPVPDLQREIWDDAGFVGRTDFAWDEFGVLGEFDGMIKYGESASGSPQKAIMAEKRREERLRAAGWWIIRWDWIDLSHPDELIARIWRGLAHGTPGGRRRPVDNT